MDALFDVALLANSVRGNGGLPFHIRSASIGLGLITAIFATKYYRSRDEKDGAAMHFCAHSRRRLPLALRTGITMEFSLWNQLGPITRASAGIAAPPPPPTPPKHPPPNPPRTPGLDATRGCKPRRWRRACERWLEGRYGHRFPVCGFQSSILPRYTTRDRALLILGAFVSMAVERVWRCGQAHCILR